MMITAAQLRAARGLMDWTRSELAKAAGLSAETIKNIEHGIYAPQEATLDAIISAFSEHNVEFTGNEGVRKNTEMVLVLQGPDALRRLMDDVYDAARQPDAREGGSKPIYVSNVDDELFIEKLGDDYAAFHAERMNKLKDIKLRVLVGEKDFYHPVNTQYIEYKWNRNYGNVSVPFYVYGDKFAILIFKDKQDPRIVVISSALVAKTYREQFVVLWNEVVQPEDIKGGGNKK